MLLLYPFLIRRKLLALTWYEIHYKDIKPGAVILYRLRSDQRPCQPTKEWRGKVLLVYRTVQRVIVTSLEEGYEDCNDEVWLEQIIQIEEDISPSFPLMYTHRAECSSDEYGLVFTALNKGIC